MASKNDPKKNTSGKNKIDLSPIPPYALISLARVMDFGTHTKGYGKFSWREDDKFDANLYYSAIQRHLLSIQMGEMHDEESGELHISHIMACCAIILDHFQQFDERNVAALLNRRAVPDGV